MQDGSSRQQPSTPQSSEAMQQHAKRYSTPRFWTKVASVARRAGYELLEKALWLHYAARRPETPEWAQLTAYGALGYFILPFDAIPDWLIGIGLTDDLGALSLAVVVISQYIDNDVRRRTTQTLDKWFARPAHRQSLRTIE